eukprot:GABV01009762.1.p1 GENE.GABV01009762.1~~GABV01009762.1.p1  ORF type:complete len:163 (+),score=21.06 GABV01009762.1:75-491(+)
MAAQVPEEDPPNRPPEYAVVIAAFGDTYTRKIMVHDIDLLKKRFHRELLGVIVVNDHGGRRDNDAWRKPFRKLLDPIRTNRDRNNNNGVVRIFFTGHRENRHSVGHQKKSWDSTWMRMEKSQAFLASTTTTMTMFATI